jgi:hypothetical protein
MAVLSFTIASRYCNCCTDGNTSLGNYGYNLADYMHQDGMNPIRKTIKCQCRDRKLHGVELHNLYPSQNISTTAESRMICWTGHAQHEDGTLVGDINCTNSAGKLGAKTPLGTFCSSWMNNIIIRL